MRLVEANRILLYQIVKTKYARRRNDGVRRQYNGAYMLAPVQDLPVQDLACYSRVGSVAMIVHKDRNSTVPNAVGKVHG